MDNYPDDVWNGDPRAPWNDYDEPEQEPVEDEDYDGRFSRIRDEQIEQHERLV